MQNIAANAIAIPVLLHLRMPFLPAVVHSHPQTELFRRPVALECFFGAPLPSRATQLSIRRPCVTSLPKRLRGSEQKRIRNFRSTARAEHQTRAAVRLFA